MLDTFYIFIFLLLFDCVVQFMRGGHRRGRVASHTCCHGGTWYITLEEEEMRNTLGEGRF